MNAAKQIDAVPEYVTPEFQTALAHLVVDGHRNRLTGQIVFGRGEDADYLAEWLNWDVYDQVLPGVATKVVSGDGRSVQTQYRKYAVSEIELALTLPGVQHAIEVLRELRAEEAAEDEVSAKREQARAASRERAGRAEFKRVPLVYREVQQLRRVVAILADQVDRLAPGSVTKLIGDIGEPLPDVE